MDNPERHLCEWLSSCFGFSSDAADERAQQCVEFMRNRGWQFEPTDRPSELPSQEK